MNLNCSIIILNDLGFTWNFKCLNFSLVDNNLSENFFRNLFFDKVFSFVDNFFDYLLNDFNLSLVMNFFLYLFYLVNKRTNWNISVGLDFNRNLFVVNVMFWSIYFNKIRLLDNFRYMDREWSFMIFMNYFIHIKINFLWYLNGIFDLSYFLS